MAAAMRTYTLEQGATFEVGWQVQIKGTSTFRDLTGCVVRMQLRNGGPSGAVLVALSSDAPPTAAGSTIAVTDAAAGRILLTITDEESAAFTIPDGAELRGDVEIEFPSGAVERAVKGTFVLDAEGTTN